MAVDLYPEEKKEEKAKKDFVPIHNLPTLCAQVQYKDSFGHIGISGLLRVVDYHKKHTASNAETDYVLPTWGINCTSVINLVAKKTTLKLQGVYGQGIGGYLTAFGDTPEAEPKDVYLKDNKVATINTLGGYAGIEHCWSSQFRSTVVYGILNTPGKHPQRKAGAYRQGHHASGNVTYHPTEQISFGIGYLYTGQLAVDSKETHTTQSMAQATVSLKI